MEQINDRLNKIANKRAELDAQAAAKKKNEIETINMYEKKFKELAPRIKEIITLCRALLENDFPIGRDGKLKTDGIRHNLGIYFERTWNGLLFLNVGIAGGGCCGYDLAINENGELVKNPLDIIVGARDYNVAYRDYVNKARQFVDDFDDFEQRFYDYVDSL